MALRLSFENALSFPNTIQIGSVWERPPFYDPANADEKVATNVAGRHGACRVRTCCAVMVADILRHDPIRQRLKVKPEY